MTVTLTYDPDALQVHIQTELQESNPHVEILTAKDYEIQNDAELNLASELVKELSRAVKDLDAMRVAVTGPLHKAQTDINSLFPIAKLKIHIQRLKALIGEYTRAQQEAQRQMLAAAAEKAMALQLQAQAAERAGRGGAGAAGVALQAAQVVMDQALQIAQATPATKVQGVSVSETWDFELEDERLVPMKFWTVDGVKISLAVKAGVREIPGIRIFSKAAVRVSTGAKT